MALAQPTCNDPLNQDGINNKQGNGYIKEDHALGQI
jgi:hypothetical protein